MAITLRKDEEYNMDPEEITMEIMYGQCINRFCKPIDPHITPEFNSSGSLVNVLLGSRPITATECAPRREGILCGKCKTGFTLTMYSAVSKPSYAFRFKVTTQKHQYKLTPGYFIPCSLILLDRSHVHSRICFLHLELFCVFPIRVWLSDLIISCINPFTATGYVDIPPPRWPTFLVTLFPILKEGMGLSLLDEFEVQYHVIKK